MLSFKRLDVYQFSIQFLSIAYETAEAAGKVSPAEASHHYAIARGSAMECSAILDATQDNEID
jgi:four helix bundle protein